MKKETFLIYYLPGCYGTFVEWLCQQLYYNKPIIDLPFLDDGSSHKYIGNLFFPDKVKIKEYLNSDQTFRFARIINSVFEDNTSIEKETVNKVELAVKEDLEFLFPNFKKILVIHPTNSSKLWIYDNALEKCKFNKKELDALIEQHAHQIENILPLLLPNNYDSIIKTLTKEISTEKTLQWGKNSLKELDNWELREFLSLYWFERDGDMYDCWNILSHQFPNIKFVSVDTLKINTLLTIEDIFSYFEISNFDTHDLNYVIDKWKQCQYHLNKDDDLKLIVDKLIENVGYDWKHLRLTILDEAFIQKELLKHGIEIQCYGLNIFPTDTKTFNKVLLR
jgi:hypothetical protein